MMSKIKSTPVEPGSVEDMIREVDEDGDGKLNFREVVACRNASASISLFRFQFRSILLARYAVE